MYLVTITVNGNTVAVPTESRPIARAINQLASENPDKLTVNVTKEVSPRPVKFKSGKAVTTEAQKEVTPVAETKKKGK